MNASEEPAAGVLDEGLADDGAGSDHSENEDKRLFGDMQLVVVVVIDGELGVDIYIHSDV